VAALVVATANPDLYSFPFPASQLDGILNI
jgi:hypothetical protein